MPLLYIRQREEQQGTSALTYIIERRFHKLSAHAYGGFPRFTFACRTSVSRYAYVPRSTRVLQSFTSRTWSLSQTFERRLSSRGFVAFRASNNGRFVNTGRLLARTRNESSQLLIIDATRLPVIVLSRVVSLAVARAIPNYVVHVRYFSTRAAIGKFR